MEIRPAGRREGEGRANESKLPSLAPIEESWEEGIKTRTPTPWGIRMREKRRGEEKELLRTMMAKKCERGVSGVEYVEEVDSRRESG